MRDELRNRLLARRFGEEIEPAYDQETEKDTVVRIDLRRLDRIVSVRLEDSLLAN